VLVQAGAFVCAMMKDMDDADHFVLPNEEEDMLVGTGQPGRDRRRALEDRDRSLNSDPDEISPTQIR